MNLHIVQWDEESALWRTARDLQCRPPRTFNQTRPRGEPWLAWNTPGCEEGLTEFVELESVAAWISPDGEILLYYRPALEYWQTSISRRPAMSNGSNGNGRRSAKSPWNNSP